MVVPTPLSNVHYLGSGYSIICSSYFPSFYSQVSSLSLMHVETLEHETAEPRRRI